MSAWFKKNRAFTLQEFHGGAEPFDKFMYFNKRAEVWGTMRDWLQSGDIPDDPEFDRELTGVCTDPRRLNIKLESKEEMLGRGLESPETGDALEMKFSAFPFGVSKVEKIIREQSLIKDPMELHFAKLRETQRREGLKRQPHYWD